MRGLLYCGGGHTTMVHSTPAQDTAVFATPSVCGAVPAKTPSAGFSVPSRAALFAKASRVSGLTKRKRAHKRNVHKTAVSFFPAGLFFAEYFFVRAAGDWGCFLQSWCV